VGWLNLLLSIREPVQKKSGYCIRDLLQGTPSHPPYRKETTGSQTSPPINRAPALGVHPHRASTVVPVLTKIRGPLRPRYKSTTTSFTPLSTIQQFLAIKSTVICPRYPSFFLKKVVPIPPDPGKWYHMTSTLKLRLNYVLTQANIFCSPSNQTSPPLSLLYGGQPTTTHTPLVLNF